MSTRSRGRKTRRRWAWATVVVGLFTASFGGYVGWFSSPAAWTRATGWDDVPPALRPSLAPPAVPAAGNPRPEVRWLGHSGFSIRWGGLHLLLDPNTSAWCTISRRVLEPAVEARALGPVDAVLISHAHFDHLDLPTLRQLPSVGRIALPAGNEALLDGVLAARAWPVVPGDRMALGDLEIVAVPAAHNSDRLHPLHSAPRAVGWVIRRGREALYYSGDTGAQNDFEAIAREFRPRLAILPIGAYAPSFPLRRYHLSPEDAVDAARRLGVRTVIPCHFGTFTLSLDRPAAALPRFARAAAEAGLRWEMPRLLYEQPTAEGARFAREGAAR